MADLAASWAIVTVKILRERTGRSEKDGQASTANCADHLEALVLAQIDQPRAMPNRGEENDKGGR